MTEAEAKKEAWRIYEEWSKKREQIEKEARANGTWQKTGLDSNRHLFKFVDDEAKEKLEALKVTIDKK